MKTAVVILFSSMLLFSCGSDGEKGVAKVQVALIDAPADYEAVLIDIQDVQINTGSDTATDNGWQTLEGSSFGIYDLLKLTNGEEAFLGEIELPEGQLGQVRLILGDENTLFVDGEEIALSTPSAQQSGLKLNVGADIQAGVTYKLILDFDAAKSIVQAGNSGKYNLKPVIRAEMEAQTGAISGIVAPADSASVVYAVSGVDSISSYPAEDGAFLIRALDAGFYNVVAIPGEETSLEPVSIENVEVIVGEVTAIDSLNFIN